METLEEAKQYLRDNWTKTGGVECPCCKQNVKRYSRVLPWATAVVMIEIYKRSAVDEYVFLPAILPFCKSRTAQQGGYATIAHFWGLIQQQPGVRKDGSNRVGWWKLTPQGRAFVKMEASVPERAIIYNKKCLGHEGDAISIKQALGNKFDYQELMRGI